MSDTGYRLRFVAGVSLESSTYGSGTYGSGTYGMAATDPLTSIRYQLVPIPSGYLADPAWVYRQGDTSPHLMAKVVDDDGPIQLDAVAVATLVLTPDDGRTDASRSYELAVESTPNGDQVTRAWLPGDLDSPGSYRCGVVLTYGSGRRMTVPTSDEHRFQITPTA